MEAAWGGADGSFGFILPNMAAVKPTNIPNVPIKCSQKGGQAKEEPQSSHPNVFLFLLL